MSFINLQLRRANAATWAGLNLASGEIGLETDTSKFKINYSATTQPWSAVSYVSTGGGGSIDIGGPYGNHLYTGQTAPTIADFPNAVVNDIYLNTSKNDAYVTQRNNYTTPAPTLLFTASGSNITSIIKVTDFLFLVDNGRNNILVYDITAQTTDVFAGASDGSPGYLNDTGTAARFQSPTSIVYDGTDFYVSDTGNNCIRKITAGGEVTLWAGLSVQYMSDGTTPFGVGTTPGVTYPPPYSANSVSGSELGDVKSPEWMLYINSTIYFTEQGNTKIRTCGLTQDVIVAAATSPVIATVVTGVSGNGKTATSLGQMTYNGTSTIYVSGGETLFSVNIDNHSISAIYTLPLVGEGGYALAYGGWFYKSGVLYFTVSNATMNVSYIYSLDIHSAPEFGLTRQLSGYSTSGAVFVDSDSLNTIYLNVNSALFKIPAGLTFALIPEQTKSPITENFVVAGGDGANKLVYSYDGLRWLVSPSGILFTTKVSALAFNGTLWVAGGVGANTLAYSSDGINWTVSASGSALITTQVYALAWIGTLWVAAGTGTNSLIYSYDGINWLTTPTASAINTAVISLYWTGNFLIAGCDTSSFAYSYDGIIWDSSNAAMSYFTTGSYPRCFAGNDSIIVAGAQSTKALSWSNDGLTWLTSTNAALFEYVYAVAYNGFMWVAAGSSTNYIAYSTNGKDWTASPSGNDMFAGEAPRTITWNGSVWIAGGLGPNGNRMAYSYDGINWLPQQSANGLSTGELFALCNRKVNTSNNLQTALTESFLVAGGSGGERGNNRLAFSYDSLNWIPSPSGGDLFATGCCFGLDWNGHTWVAGGTGTNQLGYSADGKKWVESASGNGAFGTGGICYSVKWNGDLWVAVGCNNTPGPVIAYSKDGINWSEANSSDGITIANCYCLEYNGSIWIVGGTGITTNDKMIYSNDGSTWNAVASGNTIFGSGGAVNAITWNGTMFVAGGSGSNTLAYSYDGFKWTASPSSNTIMPTNTRAVAWNGSIWVCGGVGTSGSNTMAYSTNGITWTAGNTHTITSYISSIAWNGSIWIAGSGSYLESIMIYSSDGIDWFRAKQSFSPFDGQCYAIRARKVNNYKIATPVQTERFMVAGGVQGKTTMAFTYDGLNWQASQSGNNTLNNSCQSICWNGTLWVAGGSGTNCSLAYSSNGITWAPVTGSNSLSSLVHCVKWNGSIWLAGTEDTNSILYSYDGINWKSALSANAISTAVLGLAWNGHMWLAAVTGMSKLLYSYDGINWRAVLAAPAFETTGCAIFWNGLIWVASGDKSGSKPTLAYSYDGVTWTDSASGTSALTSMVYGVSWNGSQWLALGNGTNKIAYSPDGINWTAATQANNIYIGSGLVYDAKWNGAFWVAGGDTTYGLTYSYDGITWSVSDSGEKILGATGVYSVCPRIVNLPPSTITTLSENFMVAAGYTPITTENQTMVHYSYDGQTWHGSQSANLLFTVPGNRNIQEIDYNGSMWVAVGESDDSPLVIYSSDGINWLQATLTNINPRYTATVKWGKNIWVIGGTVATGGTNSPISYSYDGINWLESTTAATIFTTGVIKIATNGNLFIASGSTNKFAYSNDGIVWVQAADPFAGFPPIIISWNGKIWVAANEDAPLYHSTDGITWSLSTDTAPYDGYSAFSTGSGAGTPLSIAFNDYVWVLTGTSGNGQAVIVIYSYDGINWTKVPAANWNLTNTYVARAVEWNGSFFSIYGSTSTGHFGAKSYDGINWNPIDIAPNTIISTLKSRKQSPALNRPLDDIVFLTPATDANVEIDCNKSTKFWISAAGTNTLSFINLPALNSRLTTIEIIVDGSAVNIITWPGSVVFSTPGSPPAVFTYIIQLRYTPATSPAGTANNWLASAIWAS